MENTNLKERILHAIQPCRLTAIDDGGYDLYTAESIDKARAVVNFEQEQFGRYIEMHTIWEGVFIAWVNENLELETLCWEVI